MDLNIEKCLECGAQNDASKEIYLIKLSNGENVCLDCVNRMQSLLSEYIKKESKINLSQKPSDIKRFLDQYVIEQERAKNVISVAIYNHYKMLQLKNKDKDIEIDKSNICLVGPTGSGKTYIAKTIAKQLNVPFAIADATNLTAAGYTGEDVENVIRKLLEAADYDIEKAEKGIVVIDEIDKLSRKSENLSITRDVGGEAVQQALLKIIEGSEIEVTPKGQRKHPMVETIKVDTSNILFILAGSFEGIENIISKRVSNKNGKTVGFGTDVEKNSNKIIEFNDVIEEIKQEDLKKFGMLPEFLGRIPIICPVKQLNEKALVDILTIPKNSIVKQYQQMFEADNVKLTIQDDALKLIAKKAIERKTGARSLRSIMEESLLDLMYKVPDMENLSEVIIDLGFFEGKEPKFIFKEKEEIVQEAE